MKAGFSIILLGLLLLGLQQQQIISKQKAEIRELRESTEPLTPELGVQMGIIQNHHAKLYLAGNHGNWALAEYQLDELEETLSSATHMHNHYKNLGAQLDDLRGLIKGATLELEAAIHAQDRTRFREGFAHMTGACNTCHQAAEHAYIVIREPAQALFANQNFEPFPLQRGLASKKERSEESVSRSP